MSVRNVFFSSESSLTHRLHLNVCLSKLLALFFPFTSTNKMLLRTTDISPLFSLFSLVCFLSYCFEIFIFVI